MRILLAEDNASLASNIVRFLHKENFLIDVARNGEDAWHLGDTEQYDCAVLDLGLPKMDGLSVLRAWRSAGREFPVLILTARDAWLDKAAGFKAGADDYLTKPFLAQELAIRLQALIRRSKGYAAGAICCGPLRYDAQTGLFDCDGKPLKLTAFEARLLSTLVQAREAAVERTRLLDSIYAYEDEVPRNSLEVLIGRLRRKIEPLTIEVVRGYGYRLSANGS
jgi:DNA-binding response OmpR family regulator